jgi:hypothetical protein
LRRERRGREMERREGPRDPKAQSMGKSASTKLGKTTLFKVMIGYGITHSYRLLFQWRFLNKEALSQKNLAVETLIE